jgi:hypothetical protein
MPFINTGVIQIDAKIIHKILRCNKSESFYYLMLATTIQSYNAYMCPNYNTHRERWGEREIEYIEALISRCGELKAT